MYSHVVKATNTITSKFNGLKMMKLFTNEIYKNVQSKIHKKIKFARKLFIQTWRAYNYMINLQLSIMQKYHKLFFFCAVIKRDKI